jgi:tRNA (uracil-5-)-methyltransferase TRM9
MNTQPAAGHPPVVHPGQAPAMPLRSAGQARHGPQTDRPASCAGPYAGASKRPRRGRTSIEESYDHYYGSGLYDARYPRPNPATYRHALRLARASSRVLDFGAGSGRYTLPLLHSTNAFICAYDISIDACRALGRRAPAADAGRRLLVTADLDAVRAAGPYDLVIALFGVLSHIKGTENRINILRSVGSLLTRQGLLLLTVPNAFRRFPLHASAADPVSEGTGVFPARARTRRYFPSARPVTYRHHIENEERPFPYYLFSRAELATELSAAGFALQVLESDSILPERTLVRSPAWAAVDDFLCRLLPSWAGYGLRATCRPGPVTAERAPPWE